MKRRRRKLVQKTRWPVGWLVALVAVGLLGAVIAVEQLMPEPDIVVHKTRTCGCCESWVAHLRENGFRVRTINTNNLARTKDKLGIPEPLSACHTAVASGYIIEGHVPADLIRKLIDERPDIKGLAVPGMPAGSPGMESPNPEIYDVLAFDAGGEITTYATRRGHSRAHR